MRLIFIGRSHEFSLVPLDLLEKGHEIAAYVESAPRSPVPGRRPVFNRPSALAIRARHAHAPYLALERDQPEPLIDLIKTMRAELVCIASLTHLLPEAAIAAPTHGTINLHPSLLPRYPGPFPVLWQYLQFERTWGVTVHRLDAREDAGAILEQEKFEVALGTPVEEITAKTASIGARLMRKAADEIAAGTSRPRPQTGERGPRARAVRRDEKLIDWEHWPIERVWHALRGTKLWLDALVHPEIASRDFLVLDYVREEAPGAPGEVRKDEQGYYATHPEGKIRLALDRSWRARVRRALRSE